ncbi:sensor histidine kinase [Rhizobium sp. SL86]|uniref:sensor histidine kinase n=1 Tax=Rhizobium sp. SL86 TaxID=2995148 RepID=UPI00227698E1|nr:ATP-binding protein [Rhizobium sp. SL86]MCY1666917.1 ATP-binding protein [Rhizobium sp. SL86]
MSVATLLFRSGEGDTRRQNWAFGLASCLLAAVVFYIDTFTEIEGAIAVLYVVALLLASQCASPGGLVATAAVFALAAVTSFLSTHGDAGDLQASIRLTVALAALAVTLILLMKAARAREDLMRANRAMRNSERRYRSIFERTRVALWERDYSRLRQHLSDLVRQGIVDMRAHARANPSFVDHCIDLIEVVAANDAARDLIGPNAGAHAMLANALAPSRETFVAVLQAMVRGEQIFEDTVLVRAENGEDKLVLLSISFPEDQAAFHRVVVSMVDVTQREMAIRALAEAQAELVTASKATMVGTMSASLAHELNQPLGAIILNAETLLRWLNRDPPDLAAARRSAERIIRDGHRAGDVIDNTRQLLAASRRRMEAVDLHALAEETAAMLEHDLRRANVRLDLARPDEAATIQGVRIELQQVLINLLTNAIQAIEGAGLAEGTIFVSFRREHDRICVEIRDTGPGLASDVRDKLFRPFFTTKTSGLGMGLSICRSTLEQRGGRLEGENHADGGAVFRMVLPVEADVVPEAANA